jgi:hypothetical protein
MEIVMNKIIVIENCRTCPYLGFKKRSKRYVCTAMSIDVTKAVKDYTISEQCMLDNALVEKKYFNDPTIVTSEGEAVCKAIPENDANENLYIIGKSYTFQRQVDGLIRVYNYGIDSTKYFAYPYKVFIKYFQVNEENSLNVNSNDICKECGRPIKYCECL